MDRWGVDVRLNTPLTASMAIDAQPDLLVIASGGRPVRIEVPGIDKPHVVDAWDVLAVSADAADMLDTAARLTEARTEAKGGPANSVCWAFRGAVGGAGVSTLAIESAFALARLVGPGKVCLVDLNLSDGMTASFLEAVPKLDLPALSSAPERLDARLLAAWCWQHEDGVSIIASPRNPEADAMATEAAVLRLLDVTCAAFPYVILDMPRHMMPWTKPVLSAVDQAVIVSELTVPSLHAAADIGFYGKLGAGTLQPVSVVIIIGVQGVGTVHDSADLEPRLAFQAHGKIISGLYSRDVYEH